MIRFNKYKKFLRKKIFDGRFEVLGQEELEKLFTNPKTHIKRGLYLYGGIKFIEFRGKILINSTDLKNRTFNESFLEHFITLADQECPKLWFKRPSDFSNFLKIATVCSKKAWTNLPKPEYYKGLANLILEKHVLKDDSI